MKKILSLTQQEMDSSQIYPSASPTGQASLPRCYRLLLDEWCCCCSGRFRFPGCLYCRRRGYIRLFYCLARTTEATTTSRTHGVSLFACRCFHPSFETSSVVWRCGFQGFSCCRRNSGTLLLRCLAEICSPAYLLLL